MSISDAVAELLVAALPKFHNWTGRPGLEQLASLPGGPAVLLFVDQAQIPVLLMTTQQLKRLVISRLNPPDTPRRGRADLADVVRGVRWRAVHCRFEARWWYYRLTRALHPHEYRKLVSFGPAWFLHVDWRQPAAGIRVSERIWELPGDWLGPWPARSACQQALEGLWDLFELCRYPEQIRRAPHGQRCAYAEMGRCDAPCDGSVPLDAYVARCRDAWNFAVGGPETWLREAEQRMRRAATDQQYEHAGQIKQQTRFARTWQSQWAPRIRRGEELNDLLVLPVTRRRAWKLMLFRRGVITDGPVVPERHAAQNAEAWTRAQLADPMTEEPPTVRMEQTWLHCQLRFGRDSSDALLLALPGDEVPPALEETVAKHVAALRKERADAASTRKNRSQAGDPPQSTPPDAAANE